VLDWIRLAVLAIGIVFVAGGLLPWAEAATNLARVAPLLLFLGSVIVLAQLTKQAKVFDVIATRLAVVGRGDYRVLFVLCVGFATLTTVFLNLDTTAVLLTPVLLALAPKARIAPLPLAMCTVWLANTASLLLPVSNLTNLLAVDRISLSAPEFAARMALPQVAVVLVTTGLLWVCFWRRGARGADRYRTPEPLVLAEATERTLFRVAAISCLVFIVAIPFVGAAIGIAATAAAVIVLIAFAVLEPAHLRWSLIPWQLLVLVTGLFLVVPTLSRLGLAELMTSLIGDGNTVVGAFRAATAGAGLSNVVNNLPAYTAGEAVVPAHHETQLLALLIGTNVGPVVTPWASLATLLCLESCRYHGVIVRPGRFTLYGLVLAVTAVPAGVCALLLT
jgi:Na+/H+ antiporter NhaD/arsenite permease-like protein